MDLPGSDAPTHGSVFAWVVPVVFAVVALVRRRLAARAPRLRAPATAALAGLALCACANYTDFGTYRYGTYLNEWDVFHYYVGTKYADELGYFGLYEAALVADHDGLRRYHNPRGRIRDLETIGFVKVETVLARADAIRARFSPARYRAFVADVAFFARSLPEDRFSILLCDRGYNGTPIYTALVRTFLSGPLRIDRPLSRAALLSVDVLLLLGTAYALARAYGTRVALASVVFVGTHYLLSWGHLKGALVRTDYACALVLAACALRLGRPALAGGLVALAASSRGFPALVLLGPLAVLLGGYVRTRRWDPALVRCLAGAAGTGIVLLGFSLAVLGGPGLFVDWLRKISHHAGDPNTWNIGYRVLMDADIEGGVPIYVHMRSLLADDAWLRLQHAASRGFVGFAVLLPTLAFASRLRPDRALALGYVFLFFLVPVAYYYQLVLLLLFLFFVADEDAPLAAVGESAMWLVGALGYLLFAGVPGMDHVPMLRAHHQAFPTYYTLSAALLVVSLLAVTSAAIEARRAEAR